jgi:hypothetical protein
MIEKQINQPVVDVVVVVVAAVQPFVDAAVDVVAGAA